MAGRIAYQGNIVTQGLVLNLDAAIQGSYPKTGSTWFDISNNGNNGILISSSLYDPTVFGNVTFNGTGSYVQFPVNSFPSGNADLSFNSWVKWNGDGLNNSDFIIGYGNDTAPNKVPLILIDPNKKARFEFGSSAGVVTSSFDIPTGSWTSITATYNRSFNTLYVNGSPVGNRAYNAAGIEPNGFNGLNGALGALFSTYGNVGTGTTRRYGTFNGNIAVAQVYNIPLSQFQVWQNFNAYKYRYGIPDIVTDGLVLNLDAGNPYSYLSGSSGTTWSNTSGIGNNATLVNGPTYSNGYIRCDGTNDYIEVLDNSSLDFGSGSFTVEYWFRKLATTVGYDNIWGPNKWNTGAQPGTNEWSLAIGNGATGTGNQYGFVVESGSVGYGISETTTTQLSLNTWYQLVGQRDGANFKTYLNGTLTMNVTASGFTTSSVINNISGRNLRINNSAINNYYTNADNANLKIYNRALSADEVQQNFNALRGRYGI